MAKKKKTRKQKISADKRHVTYKAPSQSISIPEITAPIVNPAPQFSKTQKSQISILEYSYLYSDLRKTILVTTAIVIIELLIRYYVFGA